MKNSEKPKPPRIVHLLGGLRAVDLCEEKVIVQISQNQTLIEFETPAYPHLYNTLDQLGLTPVGVEFPHLDSLKGLTPADWQCFFPKTGFLLMNERRAWSEIRHLAIKEEKNDLVKTAAKCVTYLDLLDIRLMQLSRSYNSSLRAQKSKDSAKNLLFSNGFMREIDAAVHGFVADAGSFRDHIAELIWHNVLQQAEPIGTFSSFLKKMKNHSDELAKEMVYAGKKGGWLHNFSALRNEIVHVAPVGRSSEFHYCQIRDCKCDSLTVPNLHYAVLDEDQSVWASSDEIFGYPSQDEEQIKEALKHYLAYLDRSLDGLTYAWQTLEQFIKLLAKVRIASWLER